MTLVLWVGRRSFESTRSFRSLRAHRSSSRGPPCIRRGAPAGGIRRKQKGGPPKGGGGRLEGATRGGPRETSALRGRAATRGQGQVLGRRDAIGARRGRPAARRKMGRRGPTRRPPNGKDAPFLVVIGFAGCS